MRTQIIKAYNRIVHKPLNLGLASPQRMFSDNAESSLELEPGSNEVILLTNRTQPHHTKFLTAARSVTLWHGLSRLQSY